MGKFLSFIAGALLMAWLIPDDRSEYHLASYKAGRADALRATPINWELEQTCVSLWAGKHTLVENK